MAPPFYFKTSSGASPPLWLLHKKARLWRAFFYILSFFCLPNKRKNQRKIHLRCFSISSEIAKKLGASKTSFAVQSKVSALFPIFYQILREKQRGHFFLSWRIIKTTRCGYSTKRLACSEPFKYVIMCFRKGYDCV